MHFQFSVCIFNHIFVVSQGFAIGNGLTNPEIQYKAYTDYALDNKLITKADHDNLSRTVSRCEQAIKLCGKLWFHVIAYI